MWDNQDTADNMAFFKIFTFWRRRDANQELEKAKKNVRFNEQVEVCGLESSFEMLKDSERDQANLNGLKKKAKRKVRFNEEVQVRRLETSFERLIDSELDQVTWTRQDLIISYIDFGFCVLSLVWLLFVL